MRVPRPRAIGFLALSFLFSAVCPPSRAADLSDNAAAQRVLGPEWINLSRRAGMIFAGTVLSAGPSAGCGTKPGGREGTCTVSAVTISPAVSSLELRFRIDLPIAGVGAGKTLTIRQWTGALSRQRPLYPGDRVLLFLYPPSRLGLTSPVAGPQGQIPLDSTGRHVKQGSPPSGPITVKQLARAIRAARGE